MPEQPRREHEREQRAEQVEGDGEAAEEPARAVEVEQRAVDVAQSRAVGERLPSCTRASMPDATATTSVIGRPGWSTKVTSLPSIKFSAEAVYVASASA